MRKSTSTKSLMESISEDGGHKLAELEMKRRKKKKDKKSSSSRKNLKPRVGMDGARAGKLKSLSRNSGTLVPRSKKELRQYSKMRKSTDNLMAGFDFETTSSGKFKTFASHSNLDQKIGSPKKKSPRPETSPSMEDIPKPTRTLAVPPLRMPRPPTSKPEPSKSPDASTRKRPLSVEIDENEELRLDKLRNSPFHRKSRNQSPDAMRRSKLDLLEQSQNLILPSERTGEDEEEDVIVEKTKKKRTKRKKKTKTTLNLDSTTDRTRDSLDDLFKSDLDEDLDEDVNIDDLFSDLTPKTRAKKVEEVKKVKEAEKVKKREKLTLNDTTKTKTTTQRERKITPRTERKITPRRDPIIDSNRSKKRAELFNRTRLLLKRRRESKEITKDLILPSTNEETKTPSSNVESKEKNDLEVEVEEEEEDRLKIVGNNVRFPKPPTEFVDSHRTRRRRRKIDGEDKVDDEDITSYEEEEKEDDSLLSTGDDDKFSTATSRLSTVLQKRTWSSRFADSIGSIFNSTSIAFAGLTVGMFGLRSTTDEIEAPKTRTLDEDEEIRHTLPNGAELEALPDELDEEAEDRAQPQLLTRIEIVESGLIPGDSFVDHPLVCVHIVDARNGEYLRKRTWCSSETFNHINYNTQAQEYHSCHSFIS